MATPLLRVLMLPRAPYKQILALQQQLRARRQSPFHASSPPSEPDTLLLLEHEPIYTQGRHANPANIVWPLERIERELQTHVIATDRGGDVTYHGPGVLCAYHVADLRALSCTVKGYVARLEHVMVRTARHYGVQAHGGYVAR